MRVLTMLTAALFFATTAHAAAHKKTLPRSHSPAKHIAVSVRTGAPRPALAPRHPLSGKHISATVTAYTPAPRENNGRGHKSGTAIGTRIRPGIVAVSRDLLRAGWDFGDKVHIKGLGVFIIEDTMHQRFRRTIDVAVPDMAAAEKIGKRRNIEVTLLEAKGASDS